MLGDIDTRMKTMWLKTRKWKPGDLEGKSVEFHITFSDATAEGLGEFIVRGNGVDLMGIDIIVPHPEDRYDQYYHVSESLAAAIEAHPDQTKAVYRCVGLF